VTNTEFENLSQLGLKGTIITSQGQDSSEENMEYDDKIYIIIDRPGSQQKKFLNQLNISSNNNS
jgi:hypothetical protein